MRVRIEAIISTAGNDEAYVGHHLGLATIGRPLKKMVVTFEDDLDNDELSNLIAIEQNQKEFCRSFVMGVNAIQIHSFQVIRNLNQ